MSWANYSSSHIEHAVLGKGEEVYQNIANTVQLILYMASRHQWLLKKKKHLPVAF